MFAQASGLLAIMGACPWPAWLLYFSAVWHGSPAGRRFARCAVVIDGSSARRLRLGCLARIVPPSVVGGRRGREAWFEARLDSEVWAQSPPPMVVPRTLKRLFAGFGSGRTNYASSRRSYGIGQRRILTSASKRCTRSTWRVIMLRRHSGRSAQTGLRRNAYGWPTIAMQSPMSATVLPTVERLRPTSEKQPWIGEKRLWIGATATLLHRRRCLTKGCGPPANAQTSPMNERAWSTNARLSRSSQTSPIGSSYSARLRVVGDGRSVDGVRPGGFSPRLRK
ncbi:hypothetical protein SAMN04489717_0993 [Actinopolymorpha singaporensis]|uniref:Uncharacterized protein n=1 Tax=Actinopolymorpha singaporensis TaxID=117157 RepID=A0A1H1MWA4_9ACTN|nr:hypothetical protein SAMN04489717_0993 [Actinopolymorpha singaporensis]